MAEQPRKRADRAAETGTGDRDSFQRLRVTYGYLMRFRADIPIDDPLGDYSEQTGAQFG